MRYTRTEPTTQKKDTWEFVCQEQSFSDPTDVRVVLRAEDGATYGFHEKQFQAQFALAFPGPGAGVSDALRETLANIRQNSTVRFVALPFFLSASVVLANAYATTSGPWKDSLFAAQIGLGLAVVGIVFEIALSRNLICWWKAIAPKAVSDPWNMVYAHRSSWMLWPTRYALFAPYVAALVFWIPKNGFSASAAWISAACVVVGATLIWQFASTPYKPRP